MRGALARLRRLGRLEEGPLPDGFASLDSSLCVLSAAFAWGDVAASLEAGARSAELEGPESPWRPVVTWSLGWGHYCNGDLDLAERWLAETAALAPAADQWIVGTGAIADLSLIAGLRGRPRSSCAWRPRPSTRRASRGCWRRARWARCTRRTASRWPRTVAARRHCPQLEQGVFLRRLWGQPLDLADGLIALAAATAGAGDRERAAELFAERRRCWPAAPPRACCPRASRPLGARRAPPASS